MRKIIIFTFLTLLISAIFANDSEEKLFILEDETFHSNELSELLQYYQKNPIEINFASTDIFSQLPWLSEDDIASIINYRKDKLIKNRNNLSESGLNSITIDEILPYISFSKKRSKHLYSRTYFSYQNKYKDELYPYKTYQKVQYIFPNFSLGGQIQKDVAEANYADFSSYYFSLHNYRFIDKIIVGKYKIAFGQGLLFSPALGTRKTSATTSVPHKKYFKISPYTSTFEMWDLQGTVVSLRHKNFYFVPFYSHTHYDGIFSDGKLTSFNLTGLHSDLTKKDNVRNQLFGFSSCYRNNDITIGTVYYSEKYIPKNSQYSTLTSENNFSLFFDITKEDLSFFGEFAGNKNKYPHNFIIGLKLSEDKFHQLLLYRNYEGSNSYFHAKPFAATSTPENEKGIYYGITYTPFSKFKLSSYFDIWRHDKPRYFEDMPTTGNDQLLQMEYQFSNQVFRFLYKRKQKEIYKSFAETAKITTSKRETFRFDWIQPIISNLHLKSRFEISLEGYDEFAKYTKGMLTTQQFIFKQDKFQVVFANVFYDSDILLYLYEYSVDGIMRNSILSGDDIFSYFLMKWQFNQYQELQFKISEKWYETKSQEIWLQLIQEF